MDELWVLFIIIMMVASFVEKVAKGRKGPGQAPPQRRTPGRFPGAELPTPRAPEPRRQPGPVVVAEHAGQGSAADMIAEDFWRELTGQPPLPRPAPSAPAPPEAEAEELESWDEAAVRKVEAPPPELARERASASWEYRRPEVVHEAPVVVSMESTLPEPQVRHAAFHRRVEASRAPAAPAEVARTPANPLFRRLRHGDGLRESVILAEVFGTPRGLEEYSPER